MTHDFRGLQSLLYRLITAPAGPVQGLAAESGLEAGGLEDIVRGDERLSALERVEIYADAYFYRLLDCLKEDYPATLAVVGEPEFHNVVTSYLVQHPPTEPSVFHLGRDLANFLSSHPLQEHRPFLADLASLERALIDVFHGPDARPLTSAKMRAVAPADWPELMLRTHPALKIVDCQWRVADVLRAFESGTEWSKPRSQAIAVLVWRRRSLVHYRELEPPEREALEVAAEGATFASICEALAPWFDDDDAAEGIKRIFTRWLADGLLVSAALRERCCRFPSGARSGSRGSRGRVRPSSAKRG
jgi:hypothetical protein